MSMHAVILDEKTFNVGDLNLDNLLALNESWDRYDSTQPEERLDRLQNATIAISNKVVFDKELLKQLPNLKLILITATGTDNVDLEYCESNGITVNNVADYCTSSVSQHVFSLILALSTQLFAYQNYTRSGEWSRSGQFSSLDFPVLELEGKTLGLIGYGNLAKGVEKLALAFGMKILIAERVNSTSSTEGRVPIAELLQQVDVLSIHCPLTPDTKNLISTNEFQLMKDSAFIINTSRGAIVNNQALADALITGEIAGAGIDVLDQEPPQSNHPLLNENVPNLILTPHTAWSSVEARQQVVDIVAENLKNWLR